MDSIKSHHAAKRSKSRPSPTKTIRSNPDPAFREKALSRLLWHGGLSSGGTFWLAPLLISPLEKIPESRYQATLRPLLNDTAVLQALQEIGWHEIEWTEGTVSYPLLAKGVPLPSAEWMSDYLSHPDLSESDREKATQLFEKAALNAQNGQSRGSFKTFLLQFRPQPSGGFAEALLDRERSSLKLTPECRQMLGAWVRFCDVIRETEAAESWVLWSRAELKQLLSWEHFRILDERSTLHSKKSWSAFVRSRAKTEAYVRQRALDPSLRMDDMDLGDLLDSDLPSDFDDQAPRPGDVPAWCLLPHVPLSRFHGFVREIWDASHQSAILLDGEFNRREGWGGRHDRLRSAFDHWVETVRDAAFNFAFETILEQAHSHQLYRQLRLTPSQTDEALNNRHQPTSLLQVIWGHQEARCIDTAPAILRRRLSPREGGSGDQVQGLKIRLEPALMQPSCAATRPSSRLRRFPTLDERYISLSSWLISSDDSSHLVSSSEGPEGKKSPPIARQKTSDTTVVSETKISVPQLKAWQAAEFLWLLTAHPALFGNTKVLEDGVIDVAEDHPNLLSLGAAASGESGDLPVTSQVTMRDAYDLLAWSTTMSPWPSLEPAATQKLYSKTAPISLIDGGISGPSIRIGVRYESDPKAPVDQLLRTAQTLLHEVRALPPGSPAQKKKEAELAQLWGDSGDKLRFTATPYLMVNGLEIPEATWLGAKKSGQDYFILPDGTLLPADVYQAFTDRFVARKRVLAKYLHVRLKDLWVMHREVTKGEAQALSPREYAAQLSMTVTNVLDQIDEATLELLITGWITPRLGPLSERLRPYQLRGIAWMYQRLQIGLGVLLADEMGLGKTAQGIGLISLIRDGKSPALVVIPKSLLTNWQRELATFAPHLRIGVFTGSRLAGDEDVVLTTYARLRIHAKELSEREWSLVLLDEAQNIKNTDSQTTSAARSLTTARRVALTGTPIENHAGELWSLLDWLNPGYLGGEVDFTSYVRVVRASEEKETALRPLRECLRPILLRRTKDAPEVALSLPPKTFETMMVPMSPEQALLYRTVMEVVLQEDGDLTSAFTRRTAYLKAILHLKQICNHPEVFYGDQTESEVIAALETEDGRLSQKMRQVVRAKLRTDTRRRSRLASDDIVARSGKLSVLRDLLTALKEQSSGILIFTQFRATGALLASFLRTLCDPEWADVPFLHGSLTSQERQWLVDDFSRRSEIVVANRQKGLEQVSPILILSLKAGGTGLNLTAADRVIHFDRWWNPAVEDQATDRAHRFGQTKPVFVYNLTTQGSIESSISKIFRDKRSLTIDFLGGAAASEIGEYLQNKQGFLDLVDPDHIFQSRADGLSPDDLSLWDPH